MAAISADDLQDLIRQNDIAGVEQAVRTAHKESIAGDISYDDLRDLTIVLFRTHPDTVDFLDRWQAQMPLSPYAMTARAWALYNSGGMMTAGTKRSSVTPMAYNAGAEMHKEGMELALAAYARVPDYVPASDAVIRLQWSTNQLWFWQIDGVIADTMTATPNFGTLMRVASGGQYEFGNLCETFARNITEGGRVSVDACIVGLLADNYAFRGNWDYIVDVLDADPHPILDFARVHRALNRRTPADNRYVMDYLRNVDFMRPWLHKELRVAAEFRRTAFQAETVDFMKEFTETLQSETRVRLVDDPFNYTLLQTATQPNYLYGGMSIAYQSNEHINYLSRIAVAQTYNVSAWSEVAGNTLYIAPLLNDKDSADINAIAYSDHNIYMLTNYMSGKVNQFNGFERSANSASINGMHWPDENVLNAEVGCRLVRLIRLLDDAAERTPDSRNHVDGFKIKYDLDALGDRLRTLPECASLWAAPIDELYFDPIAFDRRTLLEIPEDTSPWQ